MLLIMAIMHTEQKSMSGRKIIYCCELRIEIANVALHTKASIYIKLIIHVDKLSHNIVK